MALFNKLKTLLSDTDKNAAEADGNISAAQEKQDLDAGARPSQNTEETQNPHSEETIKEQIPETAGEIGSRTYLLYGLAKGNAPFPETAALPEPMILSALDEIHARLELAARHASWEAEQAEKTSETEPVEKTPETEEEEAPLPEPSADAEIRIFTDDRKMAGFAYCLAPVGERADITEKDFKDALADSGIVYGADWDAIARAVQEKLYYRIFAIAHGTAPVNGKDGQVIDHFSRSQELHLKEDERGNIDYKNMDIFQSIKAGQVVCDLIRPENGTDGRDIMGKLLPADSGKMPPIPKGKNTSVTEDGSALTADVDGDISFHDGVFRVESKLTVSGNVDNNTGNIHFAGDVIIEGDVKRGFHVTAGGNLTVCGLVEGAVLSAEENIVLKKGMNGIGGGSLTAKGSVCSTFLEQTEIYAEGDVVSEVIINCTVQSGRNILAVSGKGILIGGTLKAAQSVRAKRIGSRSETHTVIKIGVPIKKDDNIDEVKKKLASTKDTLDKISKNYRYLSGLPAIPDKYADTYKTLGMQKKLYEELVLKQQEEVNALEHKETDYSSCHVRADIIHAITDISLGDCSTCIHDTTSMCNIYFSKKEGRLVTGTF